ncbi:mucin-6-like isoform X2 [Homarus americanus]|uniref:mucin-6-like isoform X2 n=1 Tax=Homarus americanus TaxID=6706 RepID=UPI001C447F5E|nr:mucin-6-like isoform X2 [Homarus americanus]
MSVPRLKLRDAQDPLSLSTHPARSPPLTTLENSQPAMANTTPARSNRPTKSRSTAQSITVDPAATQPTTRQPVTRQLTPTLPAPTHPTSSHPTPTHPTSSLPAPTHPTSSHPTSSHPTPTHPTSTLPAPTHPTSSHPTSSHPTPTHPTPTHPTSSHPTPTHPTPTHPTPTYPTSSHPTPTHPTPTHPTSSHPTPTHPTSFHPTSSHPTPTPPTSSHPTLPHPTPPHLTSNHPTSTHPTITHPAPRPTSNHLTSTHPTSTHPTHPHPTPNHPKSTYLTPSYPSPAHAASTQSTTTQPVTSQLTGSHPSVTESGRRESEPIPKKRRLLEATESAETHNMTKTGSQQEDSEDILARVCSAVGIDSDLVESVVDDPPLNHQSEVVSSPHGAPYSLQYLRGVRPPHPGMPFAHRLRRPELRLHHGMHPSYRPAPDDSYAVAEVRHYYHQYTPRPHDPAYQVSHRVAIHPGEPHHYRHFPHYPNRYHYVGPVGSVSPPITRPPILLPGPPSRPTGHHVPLPHGSPNGVHHQADLRTYPPPALHHSPPGPPVLHHNPRLVPPDGRAPPHALPDVHHTRSGHTEIPYRIPTSLHDSPTVPSPSSEQSAGVVTSRPFTSQVSVRPDLPGRLNQRQHAGIRQVYIPANSVNVHHHEDSLYHHHGHGQYRHVHPQGSNDSRPNPAKNVVWHEPTSLQVPIIPSPVSPEDRLGTSAPVRSPYPPEQLKSYEQIWGVKRLSGGLGESPESIQTRRLIEPPKPCVELIPIGPSVDTREKKSVESSSNVTQKQHSVVSDSRQQRMEKNSSQHTRPHTVSPREKSIIGDDQQGLSASEGQFIHWQNLATSVTEAASRHDSCRQRQSTGNPELPLSQDYPPSFRRCLSLDTSPHRPLPSTSTEGESSISGTQKGRGHSRSKSDTSVTPSKSYNNSDESAERSDDLSNTRTCPSDISDTEIQSPSSQKDNQRTSQNQSKTDSAKTGERQTLTQEDDITLEKAIYSAEQSGDVKQNTHRDGGSEGSCHSTMSEKADTHSVGPGQLHHLHSSRYVNHHRPASEPPLQLVSTVCNAVSRPASLPGANQNIQSGSTNIKCQNSRAYSMSQHDKYLIQTKSDNDETFMERLKLVLNDLVSVPEASKLQQLSQSPEQLLTSVVKRGGAHPSKDPNPKQRLREDFKTVVKMCLPAYLLQDWGWNSCTPDQILDQLIKVTHNDNESVVRSPDVVPATTPAT